MPEEAYERPSWDEYFMEVCNAIAKRATCDRGRSGCVIARDNQILATGYVGAPAGLLHCDEVGHQLKKTVHEEGSITQHCVRTVHAEQNAICQSAKRGVGIAGATLYCRMTPCRTCASLLSMTMLSRPNSTTAGRSCRSRHNHNSPSRARNYSRRSTIPATRRPPSKGSSY